MNSQPDTIPQLEHHVAHNFDCQLCFKALRAPRSLHQGLFLKTLLPIAGPSVPAVNFFPAATTLRFFFLVAAETLAAVGALAPFFTTVVPVDIFDVLLLLLAQRISATAGACVFAAPRLVRDTAGFAVALAVGFVAFLPVVALERVGFGFSLTIFAKLAVAAIAAHFAGDGGSAGFRGEAGCDE